MKITPEKVSAVYTMLCQMEPFCNWSLPAAKSITFAVAPLTGRTADYDKKTRTIRVSSVKVTMWLFLVEAVAHEILHLKQDLMGRLPRVKDAHNADFRRLTKQVCKHIPFDPGNF